MFRAKVQKHLPLPINKYQFNIDPENIDIHFYSTKPVSLIPEMVSLI